MCLWQHKPAIVQYFLISEQSCGIANQVLLHLDVRGDKIAEVLSVLVRAQCLLLHNYIELDWHSSQEVTRICGWISKPNRE